MECPACHKEMTEKDFGNIKVDVCEKGCKGIWFDWIELGKLDETREGTGASLQAALQSPHPKNPNRGVIQCPKCKEKMAAHFYQAGNVVTVDECYNCGGFYLDSGELKVLRDNHMSEQAREEFVARLLAEDPVYSKAQNELQKEIAELESDLDERPGAIEVLAKLLKDNFSR